MGAPFGCRRASLIAITGLAGIAAMVVPAAADAAFPGRNGAITLSSYFGSDTHQSIMRMRWSDGSRRYCMLGSCGPEFSGAGARGNFHEWSPDGLRLLYLDGGGMPTWVADDSVTPAPPGQRPCIEGPLATIGPWGFDRMCLPLEGVGPGPAAFSPDGREIVYTRYLDGEGFQLWRARADGTGAHRLPEAETLGPGVGGWRLRWSPAGRVLAAQAELTRNVWLLDAWTGAPIRRLTHVRTQGGVLSFDWAPDGRSLVYEKASRPGTYVVASNGKRTRRLQAAADWTDSPIWSPNGRRIAFLRYHFSRRETWRLSIWTMDARGTRAKRVYLSPAWDDDVNTSASLGWQPLP